MGEYDFFYSDGTQVEYGSDDYQLCDELCRTGKFSTCEGNEMYLNYASYLDSCLRVGLGIPEFAE